MARKTNFLVILIDDLRHDEYGAGGHAYLKTPHIDRIAHEGAIFECAFHTTPICSPIRASILTGQYASRHGIIDNEYLGSPFLTGQSGGFYSPAQAARARIEHLERALLFWPYMAVVDAFQHWVYENPQAASDPAQCDSKWSELWDRFMPGVDWSGLEQEKVTGWQRKGHIHQDPFYYIEYGLSQNGAVQIWRNALDDQAGAVAAYRQALPLRGSVSVPELYATAGADFAFDAGTLHSVVRLMEDTIAALET